VGLFAFVWIELAGPDAASMPMIKTWVFVYFLVLLAGSAVRGDLWLARADPSDVYSAVVSRLSRFAATSAPERSSLAIRWIIFHRYRCAPVWSQ
jgi:hypothetical protein